MLNNSFTTILTVVLASLLLSFSAFASQDSLNKENPEYCKSCHIIKPYVDSLSTTDLLAKNHSDAGLVCNDCHGDYIENGINQVDSSTALEKRSFEDDLCLNCHDIETVDNDVVFKYKRHEVHPHSEHLGDIQCADCHAIHRPSVLMCTQCHVQSWMRTLPKRWEQPK